MTITAAAPSLIPEALPAVTVALLVEGRPELAQGLRRRPMARKFVGVKDDRVALLLRDLDGDDFVFEMPGLLGGLDALLGQRREGVLFLAR